MNLIQFNANSKAEIITFETLETFASLTVTYLPKGTVALSGGATYARVFPLWAHLSPYCAKASFFPVDERVVPFDDPQSNWGTAFRNFLFPVGRAEDKNHAALTVQDYVHLLRRHFHAEVPVFDVIFLGVGDDGHTASLFPGQPYLDDLSSVVLQTTSPKPPFQRITLGMAPLIAAEKVITIIAGAEKKTIVDRFFKKDWELPIVRVLSMRKLSTVFIEKPLLEVW